MALPLLAMGLGMLGGSTYLMKKADDRRVDSLLSDFMDTESQNPFGQQYAADLMNQAQADGGFLDYDRADRVESMLNQYGTAKMQSEAAQAERARQGVIQGNTYGKQMADGYQRDQKNFAMVQQAYQSARNALDDTSTSNVNKVAALYNFFSIIEPGGRVTDSEQGVFSGAASWVESLNNWSRELRGSGLSDKTRKTILDSIERQYGPKLTAAEGTRDWYEAQTKRYNDQGFNVDSPVGMLGIQYPGAEYSPYRESFKPPPPPPGVEAQSPAQASKPGRTVVNEPGFFQEIIRRLNGTPGG